MIGNLRVRVASFLVALLLSIVVVRAQEPCNCVAVELSGSSCRRYELGDQVGVNAFECVEVPLSGTCVSYQCSFAEVGSAGTYCPTRTETHFVPGENATICEGGEITVAEFTSPIWINELHYLAQNTNANFQYIEIAGVSGTLLNGVYRLFFYDGATRRVYNQVGLFGTLRSDGIDGVDGTSIGIITPSITGTIIRTGWGAFVFGASGDDNDGPANAIALVDISQDPPVVSQFISYKGRAGTEFGGAPDVAALDGPAAGLAPTPMGVNETPQTGDDDSLQLRGTGNTVFDFTWSQTIVPQTIDAANVDQTFV